MDDSGSNNNNANNSILVLKANTRSIISNLLNPHKFLKTEKGLPRDWQGLAELCGISGELIPSISNDHDSTSKVLKLWVETNKFEATVDKLLTFLEQLDREDIVDDVLPLIVDDLKSYKEHPENGKTLKAFNFEDDKLIVTIDDLKCISNGLGPQMYDAFVLFEDDDIAFATELIEIMEKNYNLKFCVKERDLIAGKSEHEAIIKLITERCGRVIVILSPAFLQSNVNKFFYSLTQSIAIVCLKNEISCDDALKMLRKCHGDEDTCVFYLKKQRQRKIIPCIYKDCGTLPPELSYYFKLDFRRAGPFWNFWDKLNDSIKMPEYKPKMKLSLPENSLFCRNENLEQNISRSLSNAEQLTIPNKIKSTTHNSISNSVKFSSMTNLPVTEVPQENIAPSTSANCLEKYEEKSVRKSLSFYQKIKKLKTIFPKSKIKCEKQPSNQDTVEHGPTNINASNSDDEKKNIENIVEPDVKSNSKEIKEKNEKKKKKFTLKRNKKKVAVLADT